MDLTEIVGTDLKTAKPLEEIEANIAVNVKRNLPMVTDHTKWREFQKCAVVGGGPSLVETEHKLLHYKTVIVAGSAHDYFVNTGLVHDQDIYCILCDPDPIMANYLRAAHPKITYLVATACHDDVFKALEGHKVYMWHSIGTGSKQDLIDDPNSITGGCTVGTRAIVAALYMGYRDIHLFGMDTCLTNTYRHHAYEFDNPEKETLGNIIEIHLGGPDSPKFIVAAYMLAQIFDFKNMMNLFANRMKITVHGGGALAYLQEVAQKEADKLFKKEEK